MKSVLREKKTLNDANEYQSDSETTGACGKVKRTHMEHIAENGYVKSFRNGHRMRTKRGQSLKTSVRRRRMEKTIHFANLMDLCHLKNAELAKNTSRNVRGEFCPEETTSMTKKDTEQYSQGKVLQRLRRQRQSSWTLIAFGMAEATSDATSA